MWLHVPYSPESPSLPASACSTKARAPDSTFYTMLDKLKDVLDELAEKDPWAHKFVEDLLIRREEGRLGKLTDKQFMKLLEIHEKHCA